MRFQEEEALWVGLTLEEAEDKQQEIEEALEKAEVKPLKEVYAQQLIEKLNLGNLCTF